MFKTVFTLTGLILIAGFSGLHTVYGTNNLQVILENEGEVYIEWFTVHYDIYPTIRTHYTIRLYTLEEDNPFINVDIRFDRWIYERDKSTFELAQVMIWSSLFSMENGSSERVHFSSSDSYYCQFSPKLHNPYGEYSGQYLCSYSFNLSHSIKEAKSLFANKTGYTNAEQSNLRCMIQFASDGLTQGITEGGQEKQLRYDFVCKTHKLEHFSFHFDIPSDFCFVGSQTLNDEEMYEAPNMVWGTGSNDWGYDSSGNPFWCACAVVNWQVPKPLAIWEMHPVDWVLSFLVGFAISSLIGFLRNRLRKRTRTISTSLPFETLGPCNIYSL